MSERWNLPPAPEGGQVLEVIDAHTGGEPLRIVTSELPLQGETILDRRRYMQEHLDWVRTCLMWEPRGHYDMYGAVLTPPHDPEADFGVLFIHNAGYSTMCGHGVIALATALIECGRVPARPDRRTPVVFETPAGIVRAVAHGDASRVERVTITNVPSFAYLLDYEFEAPRIGPMRVDIGYGGAFYAVLAADAIGLNVRPENVAHLVRTAQAIKQGIDRSLQLHHPDHPDLAFLYGVIFTDPPEDPSHHSRNICIFADREIDRSPTGTGVSARLAVHHARGELPVGESIVIESVLGVKSVFSARIVGESKVGLHSAIIPEVSGVAHLLGRTEVRYDPSDEIGRGFLLR